MDPSRTPPQTALRLILPSAMPVSFLSVAFSSSSVCYHRAFENHLLPTEAMGAASAPAIGEEANPERYVAVHATLLHEDLTAVADLAARGAFDGVEIKEGELYIAQVKPAVPEEAHQWADRLYGMLPRERMTEVMAYVERATGFAACN